MLFKSLALSLCVAIIGVAAGTIVFFLVHTDDTGEPVQAALQITKEWTTETRSELYAIGTWFTRVEASPGRSAKGASGRTALAEGDARALEARDLILFREGERGQAIVYPPQIRSLGRSKQRLGSLLGS